MSDPRRRCPHDAAVLVDGGCYPCLKRRAGLFGGSSPDELTEDQEVFVGLTGVPRSEPDWHPASSVLANFEPSKDGAEPWMTEEELRLFQMLVDMPSPGRSSEL